MKRIALYLGIAAAMVASCSIQEENFVALEQEDVIFYASFEQPSEGTRVYANEDLFLRWTADDRVSIFNKNTVNQQFKFLGETGDNAGNFNKVDVTEPETGNPISHVVSVYPYQEGTKISEDKVLSLTLPAEQYYAENTFGLGANTMVSVSEDNFLQYKNVGGYLRISLYGEGVSVSSITLKGNNGEKFAGTASVTIPVDGVPSVVMASDATTEITLVCDSPVQLGATAGESIQFWFVIPPMTFSNGFTVSISQANGNVFEKSTSKSITIERSNLSKMSPMEVDGGTPATPIPEAIDLGLPSGLKWASFNVGASQPEEYGDYYAWAEIEPYYSSLDPLTWKDGKEGGYWFTSYKWMNENLEMTKYITDGKMVLELEDDVAHIKYGGKWHVPTVAEWKELMENCTWTWTMLRGVNGYLITAKNGNSIFLPAAGACIATSLNSVGLGGCYWSANLDPDHLGCAWHMISVEWLFGMNSTDVAIWYGESIRPVYGDSLIIPVESVTLDKTELELIIGGGYPLEATVLPEDATNKSVSWSSDNESVATVSSSGVVIGLSVGTAIITVTTADGGKTATCAVTVKAMDIPEAVDLGLPSGLKWASFNLGATKPEEYGDYYAWGETEIKNYYSWSSYIMYNDDKGTLLEYNTESRYGAVDSKTILDPEDDAAHVKLGGKWRMPTGDDWAELRSNCTWTWTTLNGVYGRRITSNMSGYTDKWIFLPAAGVWGENGVSNSGTTGSYWASVLNANFPLYACDITFNSNIVQGSTAFRYAGEPIRPVSE